jgi:hypothetical protein
MVASPIRVNSIEVLYEECGLSSDKEYIKRVN